MGSDRSYRIGCGKDRRRGGELSRDSGAERKGGQCRSQAIQGEKEGFAYRAFSAAKAQTGGADTHKKECSNGRWCEGPIIRMVAPLRVVGYRADEGLALGVPTTRFLHSSKRYFTRHLSSSCSVGYVGRTSSRKSPYTPNVFSNGVFQVDISSLLLWPRLKSNIRRARGLST